MSKKRILFVTQEMEPYTALSEMSAIVRQLPQKTQDEGYEIRILMPRFGTINERRHRLHEVVRLSGMNIIVDDEDYPLIIKVASVQGARMQVYFLDNEEFFKRKKIFNDETGKPFSDNQERTVFFCKGVLETVKKFGWPPDIIHCHGPMTALIPLFKTQVYHKDPIFEQTKVLYSIYGHDLDTSFNEKFISLASINDLEKEDLLPFMDNGHISLHTGGIHYSDVLINGSADLNDHLLDKINNSGQKNLEYMPIEEQISAILDLYNELIPSVEKEEEV